MTTQKPYKLKVLKDTSNLRIVNILPGDLCGRQMFIDTLSPRYDSSEECRVSYSFFIGGLL